MGKIIVEDNFLRYVRNLETRVDQLQRGQTAEYTNAPYNMLAQRPHALETVPRNVPMGNSGGTNGIYANGNAYIVLIKPSSDFNFRYIEFYTTACDLGSAGYSSLGVNVIYYGNESTFTKTWPYLPKAAASKTATFEGNMTDTGTTYTAPRLVTVDYGSTVSLQGGLVHGVGISFQIIGAPPDTGPGGTSYYISILTARNDSNFLYAGSEASQVWPLVLEDSGSSISVDGSFKGVPYIRLY